MQLSEIGFSCVELCLSELSSVWLGLVGLDLVGRCRVRLDCFKLSYIELG